MKTSLMIILLGFLLATCKSVKPQQVLTDLKELSSDAYQGRKTATEGSRKAAAYIIKRYEDIGLQPLDKNWEQEFRLKGQKASGANIIGCIRGNNDNVIVISAHYDHLGIINGQIYNGADDNASGVAGLLAMAKYFKDNPPAHTMVFVCFDAEESGLQGSKAFIANPPVPVDKIVLNINLDMISRADQGEIYAAGTYHYPALKKYIVADSKKIKLLTGHDRPDQGKDDWTNQSDHFSFHQKGIPFIYFGVEDHADYHKPGDDYAKVNKELFPEITTMITKVVAEMDKGLSLQKSFRDKLIMKE